VDLKVDQLKEELEKRGVALPKNKRKKDLQKALREAVKNNILLLSFSFFLSILPIYNFDQNNILKKKKLIHQLLRA